MEYNTPEYGRYMVQCICMIVRCIINKQLIKPYAPKTREEKDRLWSEFWNISSNMCEDEVKNLVSHLYGVCRTDVNECYKSSTAMHAFVINLCKTDLQTFQMFKSVISEIRVNIWTSHVKSCIAASAA